MPRAQTITVQDKQPALESIAIRRGENLVLTVDGTDVSNSLVLTVSLSEGGELLFPGILSDVNGVFNLNATKLGSLEEGKKIYFMNIWDVADPADIFLVAQGQISILNTIEPDLTVVSLPTPTSTDAIADQVYTQNTGDQTVDAASDFQNATEGDWSVVGVGATINTAGLVTITTTDVRSLSPVTVTYTNGRGAAASTFAVTVAAAVVDPAVITTTSEPVIATPLTVDDTLAPKTTAGTYTVDKGTIGAPVTSWKDVSGNPLTGDQVLVQGTVVIPVDTVTALDGTVLVNEGASVTVGASTAARIDAASFVTGASGDPAQLTIDDGADNTLSTGGPWTLHLAFSANPITLTAAQIKAKTATDGVAFYSALYDPNGGTPIRMDAKAQGAIYGAVTAGNGSVLTAVRSITGVNIVDATPPYITSFFPADGSTEAATSGNVVLTYSTPIFDGPSGSATVGNVTVPLSECVYSGSTLTIPYDGLTPLTEANVTVPSSMVVDQYGNQPAPIELGDYSFTTAEVAVATLTHQYIGVGTLRGSGQGTAGAGRYDNADAAIGFDGLLAGQPMFLFPTRSGTGIDQPGVLQLNDPVTAATRLAGAYGPAGAVGVEAFDLRLTADNGSGEFIRYTNTADGGSYVLEGFIGDVPAGAVIRTATGTRAAGVAAAVSVDIQVDAGGYILAVMQSDSTVGPITWTGIDKVAEAAGVGAKFESAASRSFTTAGLKTVTVTGPSNNALAVVLVSVSPAA